MRRRQTGKIVILQLVPRLVLIVLRRLAHRQRIRRQTAAQHPVAQRLQHARAVERIVAQVEAIQCLQPAECLRLHVHQPVAAQLERLQRVLEPAERVLVDVADAAVGHLQPDELADIGEGEARNLQDGVAVQLQLPQVGYGLQRQGRHHAEHIVAEIEVDQVLEGAEGVRLDVLDGATHQVQFL